MAEEMMSLTFQDVYRVMLNRRGQISSIPFFRDGKVMERWYRINMSDIGKQATERIVNNMKDFGCDIKGTENFSCITIEENSFRSFMRYNENQAVYDYLNGLERKGKTSRMPFFSDNGEIAGKWRMIDMKDISDDTIRYIMKNMEEHGCKVSRLENIIRVEENSFLNFMRYNENQAMYHRLKGLKNQGKIIPVKNDKAAGSWYRINMKGYKPEEIEKLKHYLNRGGGQVIVSESNNLIVQKGEAFDKLYNNLAQSCEEMRAAEAIQNGTKAAEAAPTIQNEAKAAEAAKNEVKTTEVQKKVPGLNEALKKQPKSGSTSIENAVNSTNETVAKLTGRPDVASKPALKGTSEPATKPAPKGTSEPVSKPATKTPVSNLINTIRRSSQGPVIGIPAETIEAAKKAEEVAKKAASVVRTVIR